nr:MAG TPA: hypothetical protein [Caudoviricetes sp.]
MIKLSSKLLRLLSLLTPVFALVRLIGRETAVPAAGAVPGVKQEAMRQFVIRKKSLKR